MKILLAFVFAAGALAQTVEPEVVAVQHTPDSPIFAALTKKPIFPVTLEVLIEPLATDTLVRLRVVLGPYTGPAMPAGVPTTLTYYQESAAAKAGELAWNSAIYGLPVGTRVIAVHRAVMTAGSETTGPLVQ